MDSEIIGYVVAIGDAFDGITLHACPEKKALWPSVEEAIYWAENNVDGRLAHCCHTVTREVLT